MNSTNNKPMLGRVRLPGARPGLFQHSTAHENLKERRKAMYTYSDVVELGRAQDVIMATKIFSSFDDAMPHSKDALDEFDE
jgi:hypothetical protein